MNKKGFTLVELLVVIAIIGLISVLAIVSLGNSRLKARDAKRISDIRQIATALELYYDDQAGYPDKWWSCVEGDTDSYWIGEEFQCLVTDGFKGPDNAPGTCIGTTYMGLVPADPAATPENGYHYLYVGDCNYATYEIQFILEQGAGQLGVGIHSATQDGIQ